MDLVYIIANGNENEDLKYSLRSIAKYAPPFDNIWIAGYKPDWLNEYMGHIPTIQTSEYSRYAKARLNILAACNTRAVSKDFILMNDDFILTKPIESWEKSILKIKNTLDKQAQIYIEKNMISEYTKAFSKCSDLIKELSNKEIAYNYELHIPMIINKKKFLDMFTNKDIIKYMRNNLVFLYRSFYGNLYNVKFDDIIDDVKINLNVDCNKFESEWISIFDAYIGNSRYKKFNKFIQDQFPNKCIYEI